MLDEADARVVAAGHRLLLRARQGWGDASSKCVEQVEQSVGWLMADTVQWEHTAEANGLSSKVAFQENMIIARVEGRVIPG